MSRVQSAIDQMNFARAYTLGLLETIDPGDWFRMPGGVTHVAWQVAHLAMADYRLCLERIRGARPGDEALISAEFLKKFGRDSVPDPDPANNPSPREIRAVLDRVRERVLAELPAVADAALDEPPVTPHRLFDTKHGALVWCGRHELIHAGQIALLRRLLGRKPVW